MSVTAFLKQWLSGARLIGHILLLEVFVCVIIGVIIGVFVLINLIPEIVLLAAIGVVSIVFGPWAVAETFG